MKPCVSEEADSTALFTWWIRSNIKTTFGWQRGLQSAWGLDGTSFCLKQSPKSPHLELRSAVPGFQSAKRLRVGDNKCQWRFDCVGTFFRIVIVFVSALVTGFEFWVVYPTLFSLSLSIFRVQFGRTQGFQVGKHISHSKKCFY